MNRVANKKNILKWIGYLFIVIVLTMVDQITKFLAVVNLQNNNPFVIWKGVFELTYVENQGAAYGIMQGKVSFFVILTLLIIPVVTFLIYRIDMLVANLGEKISVKAFTSLQIVLVVLVSGAAGNLIDRVGNGYVVDFFYFKLIDFPVFNVADCYVTLATIALVFICLFTIGEKELDYLLYPKKRWAQIDERYEKKKEKETANETDDEAENEVDNEKNTEENIDNSTENIEVNDEH